MICAVDIGNSKTDLLVLDHRGQVRHWARAGEITPTAVGNDGTAAALRRMIPADTPIDHTWIGAAGVDFSDQEQALADALDPTIFGTVTVRNDIHALLGCVRDLTAGTAVVVGAGMNAAGVHGDTEVRFAALGRISGDLGGGGHIGMQTLIAACRSADGRGPNTLLEQALLDHYQRTTMDEISRDLVEGRLKRNSLLQLPPIVFAGARQGDEVAQRIINDQADEVAACIRATARRMGTQPPEHPIALGGSILRYGRDLLEPRIRAPFAPQELDLRFVDFPPVAGAAVAAAATAGYRVLPAEDIASQLTRRAPTPLASAHA